MQRRSCFIHSRLVRRVRVARGWDLLCLRNVRCMIVEQYVEKGSSTFLTLDFHSNAGCHFNEWISEIHAGGMTIR